MESESRQLTAHHRPFFPCVRTGPDFVSISRFPFEKVGDWNEAHLLVIKPRKNFFLCRLNFRDRKRSQVAGVCAMLSQGWSEKPPENHHA